MYRDVDTTFLGGVKSHLREEERVASSCSSRGCLGMTGHDFSSKLYIKITYFHWMFGLSKI